MFQSRDANKFEVEQPSAETDMSSKDKTRTKKNFFWDSLDKSMWIDDSNARHCFYIECQQDFTFMRRRHHCRKCGKVFCKEHINKRTIDGHTEKICIGCENDYY